jgi:excisionase family DNA binding protein
MPHTDAATPLAYSIQNSAKLLGVSPQNVRKLIARGQLRSCRAGVRVLIPRDALLEFLEGKK